MDTEKKLTGYPSIDKPWLKYYSEEAINAPLPECTIYDYIWNSNKDHLNNIALNYFDRKITYKELFDNIEKAAKAFTAIGVKEGDIVVTATVTTPETVYIIYALNRIGAIPNMVDPRTSVEGIKEYIKEVNAEYVITLEVAYPKIEKAIEGTAVKKILVTSPADSLLGVKKFLFTLTNRSAKLSDICVRWNEFISNGKNTEACYVPYKKDSCCAIVHTGGTTGSPKGVMLSNDNINALVIQSILTGIDMKREDNWLDIMPPFIAYGIGMGLHLPLTIGMETILIPSFKANKFDELLLKHKPIHMVGVPSHWGTIIQSPKLKNEDLSYIIAPTVGGDSMKIELEKIATDFLKQHGCSYKITKGYGMTEVSAGVTGTVDSNNELGSVGIPFVKSTVAVFDIDTCTELKYGEIGEVCISGPNIMLGYYNNIEATNAIKRTHDDGSEWIHSNDLGYINENGSLFIIDRIKRVIIRHDGFKVFPSAIEKAIASCENIISCCVVGISDTEHSQGKLPVVFAVCREAYKGNEAKIKSELKELCKNELPEYSQPVDFRFCNSLPLTPIGKIDYRALEEIAEKEMKGN